MADYYVIYNYASGMQEYTVIEDTGSVPTPPGGSIVWNELIDGDAIDETAASYSNATLINNIGKFTRETSPSLHLLLGGYITGHLAAVEASYDKIIETWKLKFELDERAVLTAVNSDITATYGATPFNKIRWEQKKYVRSKGVLWDLIKAELTYTEAQMIELWDEASLWTDDA